MKNWILRCAVLLAIAGALGFADSFARPSAWSAAKPPVAPPVKEPSTSAQPEDTPAAHDAAWLAQELADGKAITVDARPEEEFRAGHIPGALSLPFEQFAKGRPDLVDFLPEDLLIVVYCSGGDCDASKKVQTMLDTYGFKNTTVFEEGFPAWQKADFDIQRDEAIKP